MQTDILEQVAAVGSKLEKERLLKTVDQQTISILKFALNPMITFGVTVDQDELSGAWHATAGRLSHADYWAAVDVLCRRLSSRELTGGAASQAIASCCMDAPTILDLIWTCRVLNKDLRAGFSETTLNKAHPKTIEKEIPCSLAKPYDPEKHEIRGPWAVEPKLDGLRMVVVNGVAYTRNGRTIDSVGHILEELAVLGNDHVWDGEVMGETNFDEDSGKIRKKGMGPNISLRYNVFDMVWKKEWDARKTHVYGNRRLFLTEALGTLTPKYTNIVPTTKLVNPTSEELFAARDKYIKMGYEGAMLKDLNSPYVFKRSDAILKLKDFVDADCHVVDWFEGKGKHKGRLGGIVVADESGVETRVGSGFSDTQRDELWRDKNALTGRIAEVQYQNKTAEGSMRFPVFVQFRPDKE